MADLVDVHQAEWIAAHAGVPGVELHQDRDAVWMIQPGAAWSNAAAKLRFTDERRLDAIVSRFREGARGAGFWVGAEATPADLEARLRGRGFRCRKRFPGMACRLPSPPMRAPRGITVEEVRDHQIFARVHPYFGPITSELRRFELSRLAHLSRRKRTVDLVAILDGKPVGACTLHLGRSAAGLHDVGVLEACRGRGIGAALVAAACSTARERGAEIVVLISSGMGESTYRRAGFRETCRMAFWYRAFRS